MKIRRRTADGSKNVRFTFVYEAIECGKVIAKDYTRDGLMRKLKAIGRGGNDAAAAASG